MFAKIQAEQKFIGTCDYTLFDKNGMSIYIFRYDKGKWSHVYGTLAEDVREACIDALVIRFDTSCTEMFYFKGERKIVDVSFAQGANHWDVLVNRFWMGSIILKDSTMELIYLKHNECEALPPERIEKYLQWIREGKIKGAR